LGLDSFGSWCTAVDHQGLGDKAGGQVQWLRTVLPAGEQRLTLSSIYSN
jgi:hypothetical protein